MYSQMNCLIENEYIRELSLQKKVKSSMYSQMNCLIENEYIRELSPPQKKNTYVFPNELPNWKRLHKRNFPSKKKTPMYSQMNCLIENDYIKGTFQKPENHLCIPKWIA